MDTLLRTELEARAGGGLQGLGLTIMRAGTVVDPGEANGGSPQCSLPVSLRVPSGGRKIVAATVTTSAGKRDVDRLIFECE